jgi:hypothetical protein
MKWMFTTFMAFINTLNVYLGSFPQTRIQTSVSRSKKKARVPEVGTIDKIIDKSIIIGY